MDSPTQNHPVAKPSDPAGKQLGRWPTGTWLQRRRAQLRFDEADAGRQACRRCGLAAIYHMNPEADHGMVW